MISQSRRILYMPSVRRNVFQWLFNFDHKFCIAVIKVYIIYYGLFENLSLVFQIFSLIFKEFVWFYKRAQ